MSDPRKELNGMVMNCYSHPKGGWSATVHFSKEVPVGTQLARADLEAEVQRLREALAQALKVMEGFDRFRRMMTDGPDASDKLLAEDYAEVAFLQAVEAIEAARAALKETP